MRSISRGKGASGASDVRERVPSADEQSSAHLSPIMPLAPPRSDNLIRSRSKTAARRVPPGNAGDAAERSSKEDSCLKRSPPCKWLRYEPIGCDRQHSVNDHPVVEEDSTCPSLPVIVASKRIYFTMKERFVLSRSFALSGNPACSPISNLFDRLHSTMP